MELKVIYDNLRTFKDHPRACASLQTEFALRFVLSSVGKIYIINIVDINGTECRHVQLNDFKMDLYIFSKWVGVYKWVGSGDD